MNASENQIIVYQPNETVRLDVRLENETVWLTQEQMSLLFGRDQSVIARHVGNIFKEGELDRNSVYAKNAYTASDGTDGELMGIELMGIDPKKSGVCVDAWWVIMSYS